MTVLLFPLKVPKVKSMKEIIQVPNESKKHKILFVLYYTVRKKTVILMKTKTLNFTEKTLFKNTVSFF